MITHDETVLFALGAVLLGVLRQLHVSRRVRRLVAQCSVLAASIRLAQARTEHSTASMRGELELPRNGSACKCSDRALPIDESSVPEKRVQKREFVLSSLFLFEAYRACCPQRRATEVGGGFREEFLYCTGVPVGADRFVVCHLVRVKYAIQNAGSVRVDDLNNAQTLQTLDEFGAPLLMHVHSHPGYGPSATRESITDTSFQSRLSRGGHIAFGIIFVRDGYFRVFGIDHDKARVTINGKKVTEVEPSVYKLELADEAISRTRDFTVEQV